MQTKIKILSFTPSCFSKPIRFEFFFCGTQKKIFWRALVNIDFKCMDRKTETFPKIPSFMFHNAKSGLENMTVSKWQQIFKFEWTIALKKIEEKDVNYIHTFSWERKVNVVQTSNKRGKSPVDSYLLSICVCVILLCFTFVNVVFAKSILLPQRHQWGTHTTRADGFC